MVDKLNNKIEKERINHLVSGISSFKLSIVALILIIGSMIGLVCRNLIKANGIFKESSIILILGSISLLGILLSLIGVGLGFHEIRQNSRKRIFSVIGLIFNGAVILFGIYIALS